MNLATDTSTLVVFCRRPAPGVGKQRIAAELGEKAAHEVGELLLAAALEDAANWPGTVVMSPASSTDTRWASTLIRNSAVIAQPDGNLGERINVVHRRAQALGNKSVLIIGTDSPGLTPACLSAADASLQIFDTVVIPAHDGGVTLLGTRLQWPSLAGLPWETDQLGAELIRLCEDAGHRIYVMPHGSDIDTRQDLIDAYTTLEADERPSRIQICNWIVRSGLIPLPRQFARGISVVVPVLNDVAALSRLLGRLGTMHPAVNEIIVADGSASRDCEQLCAQFGAVYLAAEANRGKQLLQGAALASNDILWFLHADSNPPANATQIIHQHVGEISDSGYFRFRFDGPRRWFKRWLEYAINFRARIGVPYGDQALFVTREAYLAAGGHAAIPLFEEVKLVKTLRAGGGCKPAAASIGISPRRWERDGWLRRSLHNRALALGFALGIAPEILARHYAGLTARGTREDKVHDHN